jgi:hypothetical protein
MNPAQANSESSTASSPRILPLGSALQPQVLPSNGPYNRKIPSPSHTPSLAPLSSIPVNGNHHTLPPLSPQHSPYSQQQPIQYFGQDSFSTMNHQQQYMEPYGHMSSIQQPPQTVTSSSMYAAQADLSSRPPLGMYQSQSHYGPPGYGNGTSSPQTSGYSVPTSSYSSSAAPMMSHPGQTSMTLHSNSAQQSPMGQDPRGNSGPIDPSGQIPPPGSKPRVTATLWEDEGTLCYQGHLRRSSRG